MRTHDGKVCWIQMRVKRRKRRVAAENSSYILTLGTSMMLCVCVCVWALLCLILGAECASLLGWWWLREEKISQKQYPSAAASNNNKTHKIMIVREFDSHKVDVVRIGLRYNNFYSMRSLVCSIRSICVRENEKGNPFPNCIIIGVYSYISNTTFLFIIIHITIHLVGTVVVVVSASFVCSFDSFLPSTHTAADRFASHSLCALSVGEWGRRSARRLLAQTASQEDTDAIH